MVFLDDVVKEVADFVEACELTEPPINIFDILKQLEISLWHHRLPYGIAGTHVDGQPELNLRPTIILDKPQKYYRRRFTAAHELKHALFDKGEDFELTYSRRLGRLEREANSFASHLLIPEAMLVEIVSGYKSANITMVSRIFGVSFTAAYYRLLNSGLIKPIPLGSKAEMRKAKTEDGEFFRKLQFECTPSAIASWEMVQVVMSGSDRMHRNCLRCMVPIVDRNFDCCWGCGKSTFVYSAEDFDD